MSQPADPIPEDSSQPILSAERLKAFVDAVVAIAMTLLILPLMENVTELGREGKTTLEYLQEEQAPLWSFALSFLIIALLWINHHRVFDRVERVRIPLVWLQVGWMFTIVCLPVSTAMLGAMPTDSTQKIVYIGSLLMSSLFMVATRVYLWRHPALHRIAPGSLRRGIVAEIVTATMFAISLIVSICVPAIGYSALFLLVLSDPIQALVARRQRSS
ncbi:TMEM175 family protein [Microbacterium sp. MMO-10]|uniref:TMEM175 family protein n=1 Tax=Microbacterium sp. MMO-10 TaxID=3081272 RepID=UPI0030182CA0